MHTCTHTLSLRFPTPLPSHTLLLFLTPAPQVEARRNVVRYADTRMAETGGVDYGQPEDSTRRARPRVSPGLTLYRRAVGDLTSAAVKSHEHTLSALTPGQRSWRKNVGLVKAVGQATTAFHAEVEWGGEGTSMRLDSNWNSVPREV